MDNQTMMQYFEWYLPDNGLLWKRLQCQAPALKEAGINMIWLPPAYKGAGGNQSVGYDVYDTYDLGEFEQKGSKATKYGTREEYLAAVKALKKVGIRILADIVLNHMMGADETEEVMAQETAGYNREQEISGPAKILAWTKFTFPGRGGKYSDFCWNASNFSGTDWDQARARKGIFRFEGKEWNRETDTEYVNYDYLMGADLDTENAETIKAVTDWGKWYYDTIGMDGFRLDAIKHISFPFYQKWLDEMEAHAGRALFAVGEYWSHDIGRLTHYLDQVPGRLSLFDVPLHFAFLKAATSNGYFDMGGIWNGTLVGTRPENAVTFVDNHDSQPGQALYSFIPAWFKPIAYALILLRDKGIPCVFYGDYYGIPHDKIAPVDGIRKLLRLRRLYAYGPQHDYFDDNSLVGFVREGDQEHRDSGMAVVLTDSVAGSKRMQVGKQFAGSCFYDALGHFSDPVVIDSEGFGDFRVEGGSVSVWVPRAAYEYIRTQVE